MSRARKGPNFANYSSLACRLYHVCRPVCQAAEFGMFYSYFAAPENSLGHIFMNLAALMSLINKYLLEKIASHCNFCGRSSTIVIKFAAGLAKSCILA